MSETLRRVNWCNLWNYAASAHADTGSRVHLTLEPGVTGKTLCGREFPEDKGHPVGPPIAPYCKRCLKKAGIVAGDTRGLPWVPSRETDC